MRARAAISEETHERTSFDGPDREFVEGEVVQRDMGGERQSAAQTSFAIPLSSLQRIGATVRVELRIRLKAGAYRIPDVAVFGPDKPNGDVPSNLPYVAIEFLSPGDAHGNVMQKFEEYLASGVRHIWLADPQRNRLFVFDDTGLHGVPQFELAEHALIITPGQVLE